jgi:hypothetical protein
VWCISDYWSVWILLLMYVHTLESLSPWSLVWKGLKRGLYGVLLNGFLYSSWVAMMSYDAISGSWRRPIKTFVRDLFMLYCKILRLCLLVVFNILGLLCWLGSLSVGSQYYGSVRCLVWPYSWTLVGGHELVLTFSFEFLRLVSTLVLSRFPGLGSSIFAAVSECNNQYNNLLNK